MRLQSMSWNSPGRSGKEEEEWEIIGSRRVSIVIETLVALGL